MGIKTAIFLGLWLVIPQAMKLEKKIGQVIAVNEGDSITIRTAKDEVLKVRLADIDAPDTRQPFAGQATRFTSDLALGKRVQVLFRMRDRYDRVIGEVVLPDGKILNEEVLRNGYAWHYRVKPKPNPTLTSLEYEAWKNKLGLWVDPAPVPPWEFRRGRFVPPPPSEMVRMDYDLIISYGIVGNPKTRTYFWPACKNYPENAKDFILFPSKLDAENMGYKAHRSCPVF